jgi:hypothetical protein
LIKQGSNGNKYQINRFLPDDVYQTLEQNETLPILIRHEKSRLKSIDLFSDGYKKI